MTKIGKVVPEFVEFAPPELTEGVLYISMAYASAVHKCCCGCGEKVVTPFTPRDWKLTFDGDSVSLYPSIGNWSFKCRSHYWIENSTVKWADQLMKRAPAKPAVPALRARFRSWLRNWWS